MTAISVAWTSQTAAQTDADSPINQILMDGYRNNLIHLREWLGANYTGGAEQDHNHDGQNSAFTKNIPWIRGEWTGALTISSSVTKSGVLNCTSVTINSGGILTPGIKGLTIYCSGAFTINTGGKINLKGGGNPVGLGGGVDSVGGNGYPDVTNDFLGSTVYYGRGCGIGGAGGGGGNQTGGRGGGSVYNGYVTDGPAGAAAGVNGSDGGNATERVTVNDLPDSRIIEPYNFFGSSGGGGGGGDGIAVGGAGGAGGQCAIIICKSFNFAGGVIDLQGNDGFNGSDGSNYGGGGGGGGGGGAFIVITTSLIADSGSWLHAGGWGGNGGTGTTSNGGNGGDGGKGFHMILNYGNNSVTVSDTDT